jgi:putative ABC transport system permease protein
VNWLGTLAMGIRSLFVGRRLDRRLDDELRVHFEMLVEQNRQRGMTPEAARGAARQQLGGADQIKESVHDQRAFSFLESIFGDLRYGLRVLSKSPGFTTVAIGTLALGIGANTAIFSVVNGVLLRPLPYPRPARLVFLSEWSSQVPGMSISMADFEDWRSMNSVFESMAPYQPDSATLTGHGVPEELQIRRITADLFPTLGVKTILGRALTPEDDEVGAPPVVLLSDTLWSTKFGRDRNVVGKPMILDGEPFTVVGVLPSSQFHESWHSCDAFTSLWRLRDTIGGPARRDQHPGIYAYARLKPGVTIEQARAQMISIAARLANQYKTNYGISASVEPLLGTIVEDVRPSLLVLMVAVGFVLLIGCANIANLLMARSTGRRREMAIRKALGAGRWRLARQLLTESILLALAGGAFGLLIAWWATQGLAGIASGALPRAREVTVDGPVLAFALGLSLLTGMFFGVFPALQASCPEVTDTLKESTAGSGTSESRKRVRDVLVVGELAISLVLLVGAGLTLKSLFHVLRAAPGFDPRGVLTARLALPDTKYKNDDQRRQFIAQLDDRLAAIPGVQSAGFKNPLLGGWQSSFLVEGQPMPKAGGFPSAEFSRVSPGALPAMGADLLRGRFFTQGDNEKTPFVCMVDDSFARRFWPGQNPVGRHIFLDQPKPGQAPVPTTVIGVIRQIKNYGVDHPVLVEVFVPFAQRPGSGGTLMIRSTEDAAALGPAVRAAVESLDQDLPVYNVRTLASFVAENVAPRRLTVILLSLFAGLAFVLAAVGVYGVISYSVTQRHHEIGIRIALGASPRDVLRLVVGRGFRLVAAGVVLGAAAAFAVTHLLASRLFGVRSSDPLTFLAAGALLALSALAASYIPARRAMKVDPMVALRYE